MGKSALVLAIGKPRETEGDEPPASSRKPMAAPKDDDEDTGAFDEAADMAFDAAKKGDKAAFREALKTAIYACMEE